MVTDTAASPYAVEEDLANLFATRNLDATGNLNAATRNPDAATRNPDAATGNLDATKYFEWFISLKINLLLTQKYLVRSFSRSLAARKYLL